MEDNIKFNKKLKGKPYQKYDNYDAIEVPYTDAIPSDYFEKSGDKCLTYNENAGIFFNRIEQVAHGSANHLPRQVLPRTV